MVTESTPQLLASSILPAISSRDVWIVAILLGITIILRRISSQLCFTLSGLDRTIACVDQVLKECENARASESPFVLLNVLNFERGSAVLTPLARVQAQSLRFERETEDTPWSRKLSPDHAYKRMRAIQSCYRDLCAFREEIKRSAATRLAHRYLDHAVIEPV
ncbi:hypothetical protein D9757_000376 [Collybiopsis confluens]|uniref:Uncharacterized protein n=1 Tax=Collybiopsis confluens TaxID=2823264 RepID=A0A8H5MHQ8_9AGAR|nr:hypothetical protein D9757_000376 [Collybiopsis confluens]